MKMNSKVLLSSLVILFFSLFSFASSSQTEQSITIRINNYTENYNVFVSDIGFDSGSRYTINNFVNKKGKKDLEPGNSGTIVIQPNDETLEGGVLFGIIGNNSHFPATVGVTFSERELNTQIQKGSLEDKVFISIIGKTFKWTPGQTITIDIADALH